MLHDQPSAHQANMSSGDWGGLAAESRQWGRYSREQLWGQVPNAQPGTPRATWTQQMQGTKAHLAVFTFIETTNMCLEKLLNITQHQRAAGETNEIPVTSPEIQRTARQVSAAPCIHMSSNIRSTTTRSSV